MSLSKSSLTLSLFFLFSLSPLYSQEFRGTITGQVTDPSGALVGKAQVTAVNTATQQSYPTTTTDKGLYFIPYVLPGTYTLNVTAPGFKTQVQENVDVQAGKSVGLNFALAIGTETQKVEVTGAPPLIETANGSGGTILTGQQLANLPLSGRQIYTLLGTTPGSQFLQTQFGAGGYSGTRAWDVSSNYTLGGGVQGYQQFTLDGTNVTLQAHGAQGTWQIAPNIDALQEVNVMTTTYDARYGRTGGGTVNMVTKSGSNDFHGSAYDYLENGALNANNFENNLNGLPRQNVHQNQFGGTFGGPVKKDKIFFFGSYEQYIENIPFTTLASVPPAYLRPNGGGVNFTQSGFTVYDPLTTVCNTPGGTIGNCPGNNYSRTRLPEQHHSGEPHQSDWRCARESLPPAQYRQQRHAKQFHRQRAGSNIVIGSRWPASITISTIQRECTAHSPSSTAPSFATKAASPHRPKTETSIRSGRIWWPRRMSRIFSRPACWPTLKDRLPGIYRSRRTATFLQR